MILFNLNKDIVVNRRGCGFVEHGRFSRFEWHESAWDRLGIAAHIMPISM